MRYRNLYGGLGILLGLGAPLGAMIGQGFWQHRLWWFAWWRLEWSEHAYFYIYMAVGCVLVFTIFGFMIGQRLDRQRRESDDLADTFQTLNLLAIKDGLTGLYNHRYLQERLALEMESAERHQSQLSCLMIDIDDFKSVNDRFGHPFGDTVLSGIARIIRENIRRIDTAGRYGGEEFLIVMPQTTSEVALTIAERIRETVGTFPFRSDGERANVTLSIGIASYPKGSDRSEDRSSFLKGVDDALYSAKRSGKNQTFINPVTKGSIVPSVRRA